MFDLEAMARAETALRSVREGARPRPPAPAPAHAAPRRTLAGMSEAEIAEAARVCPHLAALRAGTRETPA